MASTLFAAFLILIMQAGFALFATGLCRAKNAAHTMAMHLLVFGIALMGFFACGFALMGDGSASILEGHWRFHHNHGFFLLSNSTHLDSLTLFLLMAGYAGITAAIPTGALSERWTLKSFFAFALCIGGLIFPFFGCWIWGLGWLAQLGIKAHLAHGAVDYAGSCTVHLMGGTLALLTSWFVRPRLGKYDENGNPRPILGPHMDRTIGKPDLFRERRAQVFEHRALHCAVGQATRLCQRKLVADEKRFGPGILADAQRDRGQQHGNPQDDDQRDTAMTRCAGAAGAGGARARRTDGTANGQAPSVDRAGGGRTRHAHSLQTRHMADPG